MKRFFKISGIILLVIIIAAGSYVAYVFLSFSRIGDISLDVVSKGEGKQLKAGEEYSVLSFNTGFGAYEPDYSFFMDGGKSSWAISKERLNKNLDDISNFLIKENKDLNILQEVDFDSTRTYHVDQRDKYTDALSDYSYTFGQNYDSPFLMYPFTQPHGANKSSVMTFSKYDIEKAERIELPIETGITKVVDLDRCYTKSYIPTDKGNYLVLINFHLSAYTSDGTVATRQLELMIVDMQKEYLQGNYVIAGGDFNKDIVGDSPKYYNDIDVSEYTWAQNIDEKLFEGKNIRLIAPFDENDPVPSCRGADEVLENEKLFINIDGFMISDNVEKEKAQTIDTGFEYSDHNPVTMDFVLE